MKKLSLALLMSLSFGAFANQPIINETFLESELKIAKPEQFNKDMLLKINKIVELENDKVLALREKLVALDFNESLKDSEKEFLHSLAKTYGVSAEDDKLLKNKLLVVVDRVPNSIVLAHFLVASSQPKFDVSNLNYFNKPCIDDECLLDVQTLEFVNKEYNSVYDSVSEYILNINTNGLFEELRKKRAVDRANGVALDSYVYIDYLSVFGGKDFVKALKNNLDEHNLWEFDN